MTINDFKKKNLGGGIGMGKTCKLKDVSFQCMTKLKKKIIKTGGTKKKKNLYTNFSDCLQKVGGKVVSYNSHQL